MAGKVIYISIAIFAIPACDEISKALLIHGNRITVIGNGKACKQAKPCHYMPLVIVWML